VVATTCDWDAQIDEEKTAHKFDELSKLKQLTTPALMKNLKNLAHACWIEFWIDLSRRPSQATHHTMSPLLLKQNQHAIVLQSCRTKKTN